MPIYRIELNETRVRKDGTYPIILILRVNTTIKKLVIGAVPKQDWNIRMARVKQTNPNASVLNRLIKKIDVQCRELLKTIFKHRTPKTIDDVYLEIRNLIKS